MKTNSANATCSASFISLLIFALAVIAPERAQTARLVSQEQQRRTEDQESLRINTTLIQVPAIVTDKEGKLVTDLSRTEFSVFEDGRRQEVSLFATVKQPFHAVLVIDTSNSAEDRLQVIKRAALAFAREVGPEDRMMVISFDHEVRQLTEFTSSYSEVESAINGMESGFGKLLYEAVARALDQLKHVEGRRAVILFSDGVDMRSIEASSQSTTERAEELGAVIYSVKFDTRWWIEGEARRRKAETPESKVPFSIDGRIPLPPEYGGPDPDTTPTGMPRVRPPKIEINPRRSPQIYVDGKRVNSEPQGDQITQTLNKLYGEADLYMKTLSARTGGTVFNAETYDGTQSAFREIAEELRNQYLIGYYPAKELRDGKYRKIKIEVARKGVKVRARPGYRSPKQE